MGFIFGMAGFGLALSALPSNSVSAQTQFNPRNQIQVYGKVLPTHSVVVDSSGKIIEIYSNTTEDTVPKVYINHIAAETEVPITAEIYQQFQALVPSGTSRVGILYQQNEAAKQLEKVFEEPSPLLDGVLDSGHQPTE